MCFQRFGSYNTLKSSVLELVKYRGIKEIYGNLNKWDVPKFPVKGNVFQTIIKQDPNIGVVLNKLRHIWIENNFTLTQDDLLEQVPSVLKELNIEMELSSALKKPKLK